MILFFWWIGLVILATGFYTDDVMTVLIGLFLIIDSRMMQVLDAIDKLSDE